MSDNQHHENAVDVQEPATEPAHAHEPQDRPEENSPAQQGSLHPSLEELVLEHENQLVDLGNLVDDARKESAEQFGLFGKAIGDITEAVQKLNERPKASEPDEWNTKHLAGEATGELLDKVREWVDWYNGRYGTAEIIRIRPCWYMHPPVVEEITALWVAWRAAYYGHNKPDTAPTYWHSAYLWPTIKRIHSEPWGMKDCTPAHKHPRPVHSSSTDSGYPALRVALSTRTEAPVIPWPGYKDRDIHKDHAPATSPLPVQHPATWGAR
ncbi:hypothetical protein ABH924_004339 [Arthrobacter sp. GAS37]|uniref:DUF4913 domain-containing protein n=1 Tax=Arthrobacter sp. GAS37 TaxID=3156261 RepID=UPI003832684A